MGRGRSAPLLVTFETMAGHPVANPTSATAGWSLVRTQAASSLCSSVMADTCVRDPHVLSNVRRLTDDGLFREFDRVVFYGASCGYARCFLGRLRPGRRAAVQPQAHPRPARTEWTKTALPYAPPPSFRPIRYAPELMLTRGGIALFCLVFVIPTRILDAMLPPCSPAPTSQAATASHGATPFRAICRMNSGRLADPHRRKTP